MFVSKFVSKMWADLRMRLHFVQKNELAILRKTTLHDQPVVLQLELLELCFCHWDMSLQSPEVDGEQFWEKRDTSRWNSVIQYTIHVTCITMVRAVLVSDRSNQAISRRFAISTLVLPKKKKCWKRATFTELWIGSVLYSESSWWLSTH